MNWLIEVLGKISLTQAEIANEINLKIDLIENTLTKVNEQIPANFGEAFVLLYEASQESKEKTDRLIQQMEEMSREIQIFSQKSVAIERATGADLNKP